MKNVRNVNLFIFRFDGDNKRNMGLASVKFGTEIYKRNDENSARNYLFILLILNMASVRNFQVIYICQQFQYRNLC
jgi:hypothetical protein